MRGVMLTMFFWATILSPIYAQTITLPKDVTFTGSTAGDYAGESIVFTGDVNGDLVPDILTSARNYPPASRQGQIYLIYGQKTGLPSAVNLSNVGGTTPGVKITGVAGSYSGAVLAAGDINNDKLSDFVISAQGENAAYIVFGKTNLPSTFSLSSVGTIISGVKITGLWATAAAIADINKDGKQDVILGSEGDGNTYIIFGATTMPTNLAVTSLTGTNGLVLKTNFAGAKSDVSSSDINKDGYADILISTNFPVNSYLVFGKSSGWSASITLDSTFLNGFNGVKITSNYGSRISAIGDINDDGYQDFAIRGQISSVWEIGVLFGKSSWPATINALTYLNGTNGFLILGTKAISDYGRHLSPAGDYNNDAIHDLLIGDSYTSTGRVIVLFGKRSWPAIYDFTSNPINGTQSIQITGPGFTGTSAVLAENLFGGTGCSYDFSYMIGAPGYGSNFGKVYILKK